MTDRFPPSAPTGLATIPGGSKGSLGVDLSWQANNENDLAGYNVYRRSGTAGTFERLTGKPVAGPAFSDTAVTAGETYIYHVTAVDNDGNESQPSNEATQMVQQQ
jgi:fibronectin type 3 domain-containing protein